MIGEHKYYPGIPDTLNNMHKLVDGICGKLRQVMLTLPEPVNYEGI
jgi:hypothetical protein